MLIVVVSSYLIDNGWIEDDTRDSAVNDGAVDRRSEGQADTWLTVSCLGLGRGVMKYL